MTPRTAISIILLSLIFPAQEFWQLWRYDNRVVNWWIALDYPLSVQWFLKFAGWHLAEVLKSIVIYRITYKIQALRMAAIVVLTYSLVGFTLFFVNFNRAPYAIVYSTIGVVSMVVVYWRPISRYFQEKTFNLFHKPIH